MTDILAQIGAGLGSALASAPVQVAGRLVIGYILVIWLAAAVWVYHDSRRRMTGYVGPYMCAGATVLATPLLVPFVLVLYRLVRPARTIDEVAGERLNALVATVTARPTRCPVCDRVSEAAWRVCAYCWTELREPCPRCTRMTDLDWTICPWCAYDVGPQEASLEEPAGEPAASGQHVRAGRRHPAHGAGAARPAPLAGASMRPRHRTRRVGRRAHVPDVAT